MTEFFSLSSWIVKLIDSGVFLLGFGTLCFIYRRFFIKRNLGIILYLAALLEVASIFLDLPGVGILALVIMITAIVALFIANEQAVKKQLTNTSFTKRKNTLLTATERDNLYKMISDTVNMLSTNRIGAIMTFERNMNLDEYIKNGVRINAPVCPELLTTIFYEGTTLHDGAVIIRNNMIEAASVYYTPTTKALNGKFGARHRASIGISEVTDAITVVVSEETGRISFAIAGELQAVGRDTFYSAFKELMEK